VIWDLLYRLAVVMMLNLLASVTRKPTTIEQHGDDGSYEYSRIKADREVRLFQLTPGSTSEELHISIEHYRIDTLPSYKCLSYRWGKAHNRRAIRCGSRAISITSNLWDALQQMQGKSDGRIWKTWLWADQICINQNSEQEKAGQVPLMSLLYPNADRVICWLGKEDGQTEEALGILNKWANAGDDSVRNGLAAQMIASSKETPLDGSTETGALASFFSRDWFRRAWILQEVYVDHEKPPLVMCGPFEIGWDSLTRAVFTLSTTFTGHFPAQMFGENIRYVLPMMVLYLNRRTDRIRLSALLEQTTLREASDQRDRVYALLGMVRQQGVEYPKPDYRKIVTSHQVFAKYTRAIIEQEQSLDILSLLKNTSPEASSWAFNPDAVSKSRRVLLSQKQRETYQWCGAAGRTTPIIARSVDKILTLYGTPVDQIERIINIDPLVRRLRHGNTKFRGVLEEISNFAGNMDMSRHYKPTEEGIVPAILKTLVVNDFWIGCPQPTEKYENQSDVLYHSFLQSGPTASGTQENDPTGSGYGEQGYWSQDRLFLLARQSFRFDSVASKRSREEILSSDDVNDMAVKVDPVIDWMDGIVTEKLLSRMWADCEDTRVAMTSKGLIALVPRMSVPGDEVCILLGGFFPFILRKVEMSATYRLVGPSYVHGLMDGRELREYEQKAQSGFSVRRYEGLAKFQLV